jgi:hypothetical protein
MRPPLDVGLGGQMRGLPLDSEMGMVAQGRGVLAWTIALREANRVDWQWNQVRYSVQFIPLVDVADYFKHHDLKIDPMANLMQTLHTYPPAQDLVLMLSGDGPPEVHWLQNLAIAPPDCYRQVCSRWDECPLEPSLPGRDDQAG